MSLSNQGESFFCLLLLSSSVSFFTLANCKLGKTLCVVGRSSLKVHNHELKFSQEVSKLINTVLFIKVLHEQNGTEEFVFKYH